MKKTLLLLASSILSFIVGVFLSSSSYHVTHQGQLESEEPGQSDALRSFDWWYNQRALPYELIPQGAFEKAARYVQSSIKKEQQRSLSGAPLSDWTSMGPTNVGGRTLALAVNPSNPNIVWAGAASGGLWKSTSAGEGPAPWTYVSTGFNLLSVSAIVLDPTNPSIMYVGTGEISRYHRPLIGVVGARSSYGLGILKSIDAGNSWAQTGLTFTFPQITAVERITLNPRNTQTIYAATSEGVYKTTNAGASWFVSDTVVMAMDVAIDPGDTTILYSAHGNLNSSPNPGLYQSIDAGDTWFQMGVGLPAFNFGRTAIAVSPSNPATVYAGIVNAASSSSYGLYKSTNRGTSWSLASSSNYVGSQGWYNNNVAVHPLNPDTVFCSGFDIHKSTDGGPNLAAKSGGSVHVDQHAIAFDPTDPRVMYFGCDGGIYKSVDGGESYYSLNDGYITTQFYPGFAVSPTDSNIAMGGLQDNGSVKYFGSPSWASILGADGGWCAIDPTDKNIMYGEYQNLVLFRSTNGGAGFSWIGGSLPTGGNTNFITPFALSPSSPNVLYAGLKNLYKTTTSGASWSTTNVGANLNGTNISCIGVSWSSPDTVLTGTGDGSFGISPLFQIFRTTNGGQTFSNVTGSLPNRYPTDIEFDPSNGAVAYLAYSGYGNPHVFKTTDVGLNWTDISSNLPDIPHQGVTVDPDNPQNLFVGTDLGVFHSSDGGGSWEAFSSGMPPAMILDVTFSKHNGSLRAATFGNGVYQRRIWPATLAITYPNGGETLVAASTEIIGWSERFVAQVKLEYSTNNGASWNLIADNVPATPNTHAWIVPNVGTAQGRLRISDSVNGQPVDSSDGAFSIIINPDVYAGWNLISLPFHVPDQRRVVVFPTAVSDAFAFEAGYQKRDTLLYGTGYWLKFGNAQYLGLTGDSIASDTVDVKVGWNLIGSISKDVLAGSITQVPNGIVASNYFGFQSGYFITDTIRPKHAYWVKVNADGKLVLSSSPTVITGKRIMETPLTELNSLTLRDRLGNSQTLYFGNDRNNLQLDRYELPPPSPETGFDVRFGSGRMVEILGERNDGLDLHVSSMAYPVTISWRIRETSSQNPSLTIDRQKHTLSGKGETQLAQPSSQIRLTYQRSTDGQTPGSFALFQNYPNPFNPNTRISYQLPEKARVGVRVFDVIGRQVAALVDEVQEAGIKSVDWNAEGIASGIYFYQITAGNFAETKKMVLIR